MAGEPKSVFSAWEEMTNAVIFANGKVIFVPPQVQKVKSTTNSYKWLNSFHLLLLLQTFCKVNYDNWPWGEQNCTFKVGSWTYDLANLNLQPYLSESNASQDTPVNTEYLKNDNVSQLIRNEIC